MRTFYIITCYKKSGKLEDVVSLIKSSIEEAVSIINNQFYKFEIKEMSSADIDYVIHNMKEYRVAAGYYDSTPSDLSIVRGSLSEAECIAMRNISMRLGISNLRLTYEEMGSYIELVDNPLI